MKRTIIAALVMFALLSPAAVSAHDVPDLVRISVFLKPEKDRMLVLVRMPANALIDFIFPLTEDGWLDLSQAESVGKEGARVWIAQMLSLYENGSQLPQPQLLSVRVGRPNDPFFNSFDEAMDHVNGDRLPAGTFITQDQASVDALLETPIHSADSNFSFEPRFARVGVVVTTTLSFLPPGGGIRQFQYEGDPKPFELNPTTGHAASRFLQEGITHYFSETDYLLFILCVALAFRRVRALLPFAVILGSVELVAMMASLEWMSSATWLPVLCGILIAGATVYMGVEAIIAADSKRTVAAIGGGVIFGSGFWFGVQPIIQFGGIHRIAAGLSFDVGVIVSELLALALIYPTIQLLLKLCSAPRAMVIIAAAIAIHISWHRMLDRTSSLTLEELTYPALTPAMLTLIAAGCIAILAGGAYYARRRHAAVAA